MWAAVGSGYGHGYGALPDAAAQRFTRCGIQAFAVVEAADRFFRVQDHGGRDDRAKQAASTDLVHSGDAPQALFARSALPTAGRFGVSGSALGA